jgi:putative ABC transport system ATP-binding protein
METVFRICDVYKSFGTGTSHTKILRGVSLEVAAGEIVFLVGPSGSGKTTLLSILGCILSPDRGTVEVLGKPMNGLKPEQLTEFRARNLGFIFQNFNLFPTLSAIDNICLPLTLEGWSLKRARARATELLEQVHLVKRGHLRPAQLSTGECQRIALARSLAHGPRLLLADEPTASLDSENGLAVMSLLLQMVQSQGMTLVVVSHDARIFRFASRILQLEDGQIVLERGPQKANVTMLEIMV